MSLIDRLTARFPTERHPCQPRFPTTERFVGTPAIRAVVPDITTSLPSGFVRRVVEMRDNVPEPTRVGRPGYIHLSSLISLCARKHRLMRDGGVGTSEPVTGSHRVMWRIGRAVENHVRDQLVEGMPVDVFGRWVCLCGETYHIGHKPSSAQRCTMCSTRVDRYRELTLSDHDNHVIGNPDIILRTAGRYVPLEIKSMVRTQWSELTAPLPNHIIQAAGYRRLLQVDGFPVHDDVAIVYVAKDFAWGSPYKEFHVRVTDRIEDELNDLFAEARRATSEAFPERLRCTNPNSPSARRCPVVNQCFARP